MTEAPPLFLCATSRLAQSLREQAPATGSGAPDAWRAPLAYTLGQWLSGLAEEAALLGTAEIPGSLSPYCERLLWEGIIADRLPAHSAPLFDITGMARSAMEAHAITRQWQLPAAQPPCAEEATLFVDWQRDFLRRCKTHGLIDPAGQQQQVIALIEQGCLPLPPAIRLLGFDRPTPLEQRLFAALRERRCTVDSPQPARPIAPPTLSVHADLAAECAAIAHWAAARLAVEPATRLGVVAPDLAAVRDTLAYRLDDSLHPGAVGPATAEMPRRYNFSLGRPLAEQPLIRTALSLLRLAVNRQPVEQTALSELLLGIGWSASEGEADERARLDAAMRRELNVRLQPSRLLTLGRRLSEEGRLHCPLTLDHLAQLLAARKNPPGQRQLPSAWRSPLRQLLGGAGWPGDRPLSSHEYQAREVFLGLLDSLAQLDALLGPLSAGEAVKRLQQMAQEHVFQPKTRGRPAVQVLGLLESTGLDFDALWVLGMNDDQWPAAARPNPFLPAAQQRQAGSAHASAEVELDFARRVHARLLGSAPAVHFSFSRRDGNRLLRRSPLLDGLGEASEAPLPDLGLASQLTAQPVPIEEIDDSTAPPVAEGERVRGGSSLLRAQAICPAWGFYRYRLGAQALDTPVEGLDPAARGTLVHRALETLWLGLKDSAALHALSTAERAERLLAASESALAAHEAALHAELPAAFRQLEARRLVRLLDRWLEVELARPEPFTVIACEQPAELKIDGIEVRMVVDRIDAVADGHLIIDYKTGQNIDTANWSGMRITEPQLPIYAALVDQGVIGVSFAKVLAHDACFAGITADSGILPGVPGLDERKQSKFAPEQFPDWAAVLAHWDTRLRAVAQEIRDGVASVTPVSAAALAYCDVLPLLRLSERAAQMRRAAPGEAK